MTDINCLIIGQGDEIEVAPHIMDFGTDGYRKPIRMNFPGGSWIVVMVFKSGKLLIRKWGQQNAVVIERRYVIGKITRIKKSA